MIGFLIKKAFFDGWDNLIGLVGLNLCYLALIFLGVNVYNFLGENTLLGISIVIILCLAFAFLSMASAKITYGYSVYKKLGWNGIKEAFSTHIPHALIYFVYTIFSVFCILFAFPFYMAYQNFLGITIAMLIFWVLLFFSIAMQFFFPLAFTMQKDKPIKTLRKCFMVVADNFGSALFCGIYSLLNIALTIVTAGFIPGGGGLSLLHMDTVKLFMLKYDWLEENADEKKVNWEDALYEERKLVGHRTLKNMIFPWKD